MLQALAIRFAPNDFSPKYKAARVKLAQSALVPSRIFDDTAVWDAMPSANARFAYAAGTAAANGRYALEARPSLTPAAKLGDTRHTVALERTAPGVFRWSTNVDLGIGAITAEEMSNLLTALWRAPEGRTDAAVRDDYRAAFPRAAAAFGRGFSIDSLHAEPGGAGTTSVTLSIGYHPELMKPVYPALAGYLDKYLGPARYHFVLAQHGDGSVVDIVGRDRLLTLRYRVLQGHLVPLTGAPHAVPDTLELLADLTLKVKLFRIGFHDLVTDFQISNSGHERGFTIVARREPNWDLPFITERLLRSPLRRPFEGEGALFGLSVADSRPNTPQSIFVRRVRLDVQESAIMRFIGSLASHAVGDLDDKVEIEEHAFLHDGMVALANDLAAMELRR